MMKALVGVVGLVCCLTLLPHPSQAASPLFRQTRQAEDITTALIASGATQVGGGESQSTIWQLPSTLKVDVTQCWHEGSGLCPSSSCFHHRNTVTIKETPVSCGICFWKRRCKMQICCTHKGF